MTPNITSASYQRTFDQLTDDIFRKTDRNFVLLMLGQYLSMLLIAAFRTWTHNAPFGTDTNTLFVITLIAGGAVTSLAVFMGLNYPGNHVTRHVMAVGQMLMGSLLTYVFAGHAEIHFHTFLSLALLALYRDWKVLLTGTLVSIICYSLQILVLPELLLGLPLMVTRVGATLGPWDWMTHICWILLATVFLLASVRQSAEQTRMIAQQQSELITAESTLQKERVRFFDLSVDMLCVMNMKGEFHEINPMFSQQLGYEKQQILKMRFIEMVHPDDRTATGKVISHLKRGTVIKDFDNRLCCADGSYLWLSWSAHASRSSEEPVVYAVARDITRQKETARKLQQARKFAEEARISAEQNSRAKSDFLANMSHEIRTPMNSILGLTELVLESELESTQRDYLSTVLHSSESLMDIINEILDFSKIEAEKMDFAKVPFCIREETSNTLHSLAIRAHGKQLELASFVEEDVPQWCIGDPARIRQILLNLIGNAIKFTDQGEVIVSLSSQPAEEGMINLTFNIKDTGIGVPDSQQRLIFQKFTQADSSATRTAGGTGLGLNISSQLVEQMGGQIQLESRPGEGSRFFFTLKIPVTDAPKTVVPMPDSAPLKGMTVLIVDDNTTHRRILKETVTGFQMTPVLASSGQAAIETLREMKNTNSLPDFVLVDICMPGMDGFELIRKLQQNYPVRSMRIISLSSIALTDRQRIHDKLEIAANLNKPLKHMKLLQTLLNCLTPAPIKLETTTTLVPKKKYSLRTGRKVLVAEDGLANQTLAIALLSKWDFQITVAHNGSEALKKLQEQAFDMILMDLQMPEIDGIEATRTIREQESQSGKRIPIIAMTAHAMKGDRDRCLEAGMDDYLPKPLRRQQLEQVIESFVPR